MDKSEQDILLKKIGNRIRSLRKSKSLTQLDLASLSNLEETAILRIEKGRVNSTIRTLQKIAKALDVEFFEIFVFSEKSDDNK